MTAVDIGVKGQITAVGFTARDSHICRYWSKGRVTGVDIGVKGELQLYVLK